MRSNTSCRKSGKKTPKTLESRLLNSRRLKSFRSHWVSQSAAWRNPSLKQGRNSKSIYRTGSDRSWSQAATAATAAAAMSIEVVEVGDDDRNRKCNGEYAGDDAHCAYQLAPDTNWRDVTVANRRHGYDRPPERAGNRRQLGTRKSINNQAFYLLNKTKQFANKNLLQQNSQWVRSQSTQGRQSYLEQVLTTTERITREGKMCVMTAIKIFELYTRSYSVTHLF